MTPTPNDPHLILTYRKPPNLRKRPPFMLRVLCLTSAIPLALNALALLVVGAIEAIAFDQPANLLPGLGLAGVAAALWLPVELKFPPRRRP